MSRTNEENLLTILQVTRKQLHRRVAQHSRGRLSTDQSRAITSALTDLIWQGVAFQKAILAPLEPGPHTSNWNKRDEWGAYAHTF